MMVRKNFNLKYLELKVICTAYSKQQINIVTSAKKKF